MRSIKIALLAGALVAFVVPAFALATPGNGKGKGPESAPGQEAPGPGAPLPEKANAYGRYCKTESRKHVAGEKGTPFSQCVTAVAQAKHDETKTAREACKALSKKHVKGTPGTPFSKCVKGVAQMRKEQREREREEKEAEAQP
jgi:hypothetical protein